MGGGITMGTWSTGLYQNDMSSDVKDDYIGKLKAGKDDETALREILSEYQYELEDIDCKYDIYLALADTLWKKGRLTESFKVKALEMLEEDRISERWESEKIRKERSRVLDKLKAELESPMPERKKIPVHKPYVTGWKQGEVYYFEVKQEVEGYEKYLGWYAMFYVDRLFQQDWNVRGVDDEVAEAYFFMAKDKPQSIEDFKKARPVCFSKGKDSRRYKAKIVERSKRKRPKDLTLLGSCESFQPPKHNDKITELFFWMEPDFRSMLRGYEY